MRHLPKALSLLLVLPVLLAGCSGAQTQPAPAQATVPPGWQLVEREGVAFGVPPGWQADPEAQEHGETVAYYTGEDEHEPAQRIALVLSDVLIEDFSDNIDDHQAVTLRGLEGATVTAREDVDVTGADEAAFVAFGVPTQPGEEHPETRYDIVARKDGLDALVRVTSRTPPEDRALADAVAESLTLR